MLTAEARGINQSAQSRDGDAPGPRVSLVRARRSAWPAPVSLAGRTVGAKLLGALGGELARLDEARERLGRYLARRRVAALRLARLAARAAAGAAGAREKALAAGPLGALLLEGLQGAVQGQGDQELVTDPNIY